MLDTGYWTGMLNDFIQHQASRIKYLHHQIIRKAMTSFEKT
jgi:hypothetical protein